MEKLDVDPSGPMVLEHLKEHAIGLYKHLMNVTGMIDEDYVGKKMTDDITIISTLIIKSSGMII